MYRLHPLRVTLSLVAMSFVCALPHTTLADDAANTTIPQTTAVISAPADVQVGRTVVLDASASRIAGENPEYRWYLGDAKLAIARGVELIFTPERSGKILFRLVVRSTGLDGKPQESETTHEVVAYRRKVVVLADESVDPAKLSGHGDRALEEGVYVRVIQSPQGTPNLGVEDSLAGLIAEKKDTLSNAEAIVVWTQGIAGIQALLRTVRNEPDREAQVKNSSIVMFTESSLGRLERTVRGSFSLLDPREIIITRTEAMNPLIAAKDMEDFHDLLIARDIDSVTLTDSSLGLKPWNVVSMLVNYLLAHGVSGNTVILLLMLPVIATVFAFLKQVVGITTFGLYTPSIIALSFVSLGWWVGLLSLLFILVAGSATRSLMRRWRLLYIPKIAIILTVLSFTLLLWVALGTAIGFDFTRDSVFMLLILSSLSENFLSLKAEEGWWSAILGSAETILGSLACVAIVQWRELQSLILAYPEIILLTLPINIFLGRWTGLRFVEYFRFREVFKHLQEE